MKRLITIASIIFFPLCAFADLKITEIMYNPEGTDTNREWIEIHNVGNTEISLGDWFFYENDVFHRISEVEKIKPNQYVLLAKDPGTLSGELGGGISIAKSSFSLKNSGEKISIANPSREIIHSVTYSSEQGANGDGKSLQYGDGKWAGSDPTPGHRNQFTEKNEDSSKTDSSESDTKHEGVKSKVSKPYYTADVLFNEDIFPHYPSAYKLEVNYIKNAKRTQKISGYFYLNFGDGTSRDFQKLPKDSYHRYRRSGTYNLIFEYYSSYLAYESGLDPDVSVNKKIIVHNPEVTIESIDYTKGVVLRNNGKNKVVLSGYKISSLAGEYIFPRKTYLYPKTEISIYVDMLGFDPILAKNKVYLETPLGAVVDVFSFYRAKAKQMAKPPAVKTLKAEVKKPIPEPIEGYDSLGQGDKSELEKYLEKNPDKVRVNFVNQELTPTSVSRETPYVYYALAALLAMLTSARILKFSSVKKDNSKEQNLEVDQIGEIELLE